VRIGKVVNRGLGLVRFENLSRIRRNMPVADYIMSKQTERQPRRHYQTTEEQRVLIE
jgi:hypothetical protein